jgi:hypothetical protein
MGRFVKAGCQSSQKDYLNKAQGKHKFTKIRRSYGLLLNQTRHKAVAALHREARSFLSASLQNEIE